MTDPSSAEPWATGADEAGETGGDYEYDEAHGGGDEPTVPEHLSDELPPLKEAPE
ncbi:hypothetical protein [Paractinoplanes lichenicola]|uniref:Uncharacterized protein n=1 Tax=Paractinoplanes lichenicola TaxID=2802976 RepID=A0ABS1VGK8_9ACTN|nr:hypothetical protein [Actinoplanes lichenicola]MBL7253819.1 hypothetical protein [Actinoplanes lichenicola]